MSIYDLTVPITPETIVFPGDPSFKSEKLMDVDKGDPFTLCHLGLGNHMGTHIDFPAHVTSGGKRSSDYHLECFTGKGRIIEIPGKSHVTAKHIEAAGIKPGEIVFFKTKNTRDGLHERETYTEDFAAIKLEAARALVASGAKIVGIDYLSVDKIADNDLPTHKELLGNGVLVVESVNLKDVPPGKYDICISPLKIEAADGLPVRIIASTATIFSSVGLHEASKANQQKAIEHKYGQKALTCSGKITDSIAAIKMLAEDIDELPPEKKNLLSEAIQQFAKNTDELLQQLPATKDGNRSPQAIMVDDDKNLAMAWEMDAANVGVDLITFSSPDNFISDIYNLDKAASLYIDVNLDSNIDGVELSKIAYEKGFKNIYLITGGDPSEFSNLDWIKGALGKNPPFIQK